MPKLLEKRSYALLIIGLGRYYITDEPSMGEEFLGTTLKLQISNRTLIGTLGAAPR